MAYYRKRGNRWQLRWETDDGRETSESFKTEREAIAAKRRIEATTVLTGGPPLTGRDGVPTVAQWWERWEPGQKWRDSTRSTHGTHWRTYIRPAWGKMPLDLVTVDGLERWHRKMERNGLASGYIAGIHRTFSMLLGGAERADLIARNPATRTRGLSRKRTEPVEVLDDATVARLYDALAATAPRLVVFARVCANAGLRRAETAGLSWDRVDLDALELRIDRQLDFRASSQAGAPVWSPTKTGASRVVPLPAALAADLRAHRSEYGIGAGQLVFTDPRGKAWNMTRLGEVWRAARDRLAEEGTPLPASARGWHTLRHGYGSRLHARGVPLAEISAAIGHADRTTTLRFYTHQEDPTAAHARIRDALS